ncbi:hypothetical protein AMECASPLE_022801, partial [Ameca splendens]
MENHARKFVISQRKLAKSPPQATTDVEDQGYEKTEDTSEKTSLADQEDARLIYLNQKQFTKFCSNRV